MKHIDITKTPLANMLELVNESSSVTFQAQHLVFGLPQNLAVEQDPTTKRPVNTQIVISAHSSSPVPGSVTRKYKRAHLDKDFPGALKHLNLPSHNFTVEQILQIVFDNRTWHPTCTLHFTGQFVSAQGAIPAKFKVKPAETDYLYCGEVILDVYYP